MKAGGIRVAVQAAVLAVLMPAAGYAGELRDKLELCTTCHGDHAQGVQAYFTAPRLAGQTVEYLENQFKAISAHRRDNPAAKTFMVPVMASVPEHMRPGLAKHFSELSASPAGNGPRGLVETGRKIFQDGVPDENVPACAACHGPDAHGSELVPRLAGQLYSYTVAQLVGWGKGLRSKEPASGEDANTMQPIASALNKEQINAVAAYLSYQR